MLQCWPLETDCSCTSTLQIGLVWAKITRHIAEVHERRKEFKWEICHRFFVRKNLLQNHVDAVHKGKRPCKCEVCNFACVQRGYLKIHIAGVHKEKMGKWLDDKIWFYSGFPEGTLSWKTLLYLSRQKVGNWKKVGNRPKVGGGGGG